MFATCHTPGCFMEDVQVDIGTQLDPDTGLEVKPFWVFCGSCSQRINDVVDYPPLVPE